MVPHVRCRRARAGWGPKRVRALEGQPATEHRTVADVSAGQYARTSPETRLATSEPIKDFRKFHDGIVGSIQARADLVNSVLGTAFWPADGAYREVLVREALARVVPQGIRVGHGFGVDQRGQTQQIDIMVFGEDLIAPLFQDRDFFLVHPSALVAAIEVKKRLHNEAQLAEVFEALEGAALLRWERNRTERQLPLLTGLVAFEGRSSAKTAAKWVARAYARRVRRHLGRPSLGFCDLGWAGHPQDPAVLNTPRWDTLTPCPTLTLQMSASAPWVLLTWFDIIDDRLVPVVTHFKPTGTSGYFLGLAHLMAMLANQCLHYNEVHWGINAQVHARSTRALFWSSDIELSRVATYSLLPETWLGRDLPGIEYLT